MIASYWSQFVALFREPLFLEALVALVLFGVLLLMVRRVRRVAAELERRKELGEYVRGLDEFLRGDFREAIATLEQVLERDPENVEARIALGDCYREIGDAAEGKKHHHHVHRVFGHELARNFWSLGRDELALGHADLAVEAFSRALELSPHDAEAMAGLAEAYAADGDPVGAVDCLRRVYPDGPTPDLNGPARREASRRFGDAGQAVLAEGNAEEAVRLFTEALAFYPQSIRARTGLVRAAHGLGDRERARALVEEHVATLRELARGDGVLFEPSSATAPPPSATPEEAPPPPSFLPAPVEEVGAVVTAVEQRTARYGCHACGLLLRDFAEQCSGCSSVGTIEALPELADLYARPLPEFREAVGEVEETPAFLQGLAHKASLGDEEAFEKLRARGASALYEIFAALPALEARRYLGVRLGAVLGAPAAREVQHCHAARAGSAFGGGVKPHDEFAAGFYLALDTGDASIFLTGLGGNQEAAVAGVMADPRIPDDVRDRARDRLAGRGVDAMPAVVDAVAASGDPGGIARAAELTGGFGAAAVALLEKRYLKAKLLGRFFQARGTRRRVAAEVLARSGVPTAAQALGRAAASAKDPELRAHYAAAKERAEQAS